MVKQWKVTLIASGLAVMLLPAAAQNTPASPQAAPNNPVAKRKENQQDRIADGIESGALNDREAAGLESRESRLNRETRRMRAADGGRLTAADRAKIEQQQDTLSKNIYNQKHDAQTQPTSASSEVGQRNQAQQERIAQGIESGQLTSSEAARLERNDTRIAREVRNGRSANGGNLTAAERQQINRQDNRVSRQIYTAKHNGRRY